jgi:hypothetical protein
VDLDGYFALARGTAAQPALEMTKWFDTNYHYLVPEFRRDTVFHLDTRWLFDEVDEALVLPMHAKVVLVGPLTYLFLGKEKEAGFSRLDLLPRLLATYGELLAALKARGIAWVQLDEPALALDLPPEWLDALVGAYARLAESAPSLLLATYFDSVAEHADRLKALPVAGLHLDAVRAPGQVAAFADDFPADKVLSLGIVDGRNIWRTDLGAALDMLEKAKATPGVRHAPIVTFGSRPNGLSPRAVRAFGARAVPVTAAVSDRAAPRGLDAGSMALQGPAGTPARPLRFRGGTLDSLAPPRSLSSGKEPPGKPGRFKEPSPPLRRKPHSSP